jgi:hypothetical protein
MHALECARPALIRRPFDETCGAKNLRMYPRRRLQFSLGVFLSNALKKREVAVSSSSSASAAAAWDIPYNGCTLQAKSTMSSMSEEPSSP